MITTKSLIIATTRTRLNHAKQSIWRKILSNRSITTVSPISITKIWIWPVNSITMITIPAIKSHTKLSAHWIAQLQGQLFRHRHASSIRTYHRWISIRIAMEHLRSTRSQRLDVAQVKRSITMVRQTSEHNWIQKQILHLIECSLTLRTKNSLSLRPDAILLRQLAAFNLIYHGKMNRKINSSLRLIHIAEKTRPTTMKIVENST